VCLVFDGKGVGMLAGALERFGQLSAGTVNLANGVCNEFA